MLRQQPYKLQNFVRQIVATISRNYAGNKNTPTTAPTYNKDDEVILPQELGASFFAKNIGNLLRFVYS